VQVDGLKRPRRNWRKVLLSHHFRVNRRSCPVRLFTGLDFPKVFAGSADIVETEVSCLSLEGQLCSTEKCRWGTRLFRFAMSA
jgi:hypothetical protein